MMSKYGYIEHEMTIDDGAAIDDGRYGDVPELYVSLFGGLNITVGGKHVPDNLWSKRKARMMFAHLVMKFGRSVNRRILTDALWPGMDERRAVDNLYSSWSVVKRINKYGSEDHPYVICNATNYRIDNRIVKSDVEEFDILAKRVLFEKVDEQTLRWIFKRMDQLYVGDLLAGVQCDGYLELQRERYRGTFVDVLLAASEAMMAAGDNSAALWFARRALGVEPEREDVYQTLMRAQDIAGQRTAAMGTYFECIQVLDTRLGIGPSRKTVELYENLLDDENA